MPYFEFLEKLRAATSPYHEDLEKSPVSLQLLSATATKEDYINYLQASCSLHAPVEEELFPLLANVIDDIAERKKSPAIQADLQALGEANTPHTKFLPAQTATPAFALGVMYVLEGSTLGGLHIAKAINQTLGHSIPKHFLQVYGNTTGQRWKRYLQLLEEFIQNSPAPLQEEVINGAVYAFKKAHYFFNDSYAANEL